MQIQIGSALSAGIARNNLIIDPGLGFSKDADANWEIIRRIDEFTNLGYPVLVGGSRKRFLGGDSPDDREEASVALTRSLLDKNIWAVRVHSVKPHKEVIDKNV